MEVIYWWNSCLGRFIPGKEPKHTLNRRLGWFQNQSGRFSGEYKLSCIRRDSNPEQSILRLVAILTTLSQFKSLCSAILNYLLEMLTVAQVTKVFPTFHKINGSLSRTTRILNYFHTTTCYFCQIQLNPLTPELNASAQRCLTRFFTGDFASWTVHFVNTCVTNQQIHKLFIQFIDRTMPLDTTRPSTIFYRLLLNWASLRRH
jgi:hypothetical protein